MLTESNSPFGRAAGRELPFPETLPGLDALPDVFRHAVAASLPGPEVEPVAIVYTPPFATTGFHAPDSVLVLREADWAVAWGSFDTGIDVRGGPKAGILKIELSQVLLEGALTIEHESDPSDGGARIRFNLVGLDMFRAVTENLLSGLQLPAEPLNTAFAPLTPRSEAWRSLPFKLRSALLDAIPAGDAVRAIVSWPGIRVEGLAWRSGMAAPGGLLAVTERYLCVIVDAIPLQRDEIASTLSQYGKVVSYLSRGNGLRWTSASEQDGSRVVINTGPAASRTVGLELLVPSAAVSAIEGVLMRLGAEI